MNILLCCAVRGYAVQTLQLWTHRPRHKVSMFSVSTAVLLLLQRAIRSGMQSYCLAVLCCADTACLNTGLALKYRCPLGVQLSCCFLTELSDRASNDAVYDQVDATVHQSIKAVTRASEEELQQMNLTFECPTGGAFPDQSGDARC